jgi:hypothetical protein
MVAIAGQSSGRQRRRWTGRGDAPSSSPSVFLLLFLLLVATSNSCARGQGPQDEELGERGPLSAERVDALISRFADLVAAPSFPPLDPGAESLLARLLDEVLPGAEQRDLRARTVAAMGLRLPQPPPQQQPSPSSSPADDDDAAAASAPSDRRRRRRGLLQNATPVSPVITPASLFTVNRGGLFGGWAQAFQLLFTNAFDFFLRGGFGFLVPIIGDTLAPLRRFNWVRDLGNAIDAPFDNVINANWFPLPQSTDDLVALALRVLAPICAPETASSGSSVLGAFRGAAAEVELVPWSCDVVPNNEEQGEEGGRQRIDWASCTPSRLVVRLRPALVSGPYFSSASYTGAACAFSQPFGLGTTFALGLDNAALDLKLSRIGVDVVPSIVQFEASGRFFPWIAAAIANNGSDVPAREVAFTSASNSSTGGGR